MSSGHASRQPPDATLCTPQLACHRDSLAAAFRDPSRGKLVPLLPAAKVGFAVMLSDFQTPPAGSSPTVRFARQWGTSRAIIAGDLDLDHSWVAKRKI
jgi:hypothetical protein